MLKGSYCTAALVILLNWQVLAQNVRPMPVSPWPAVNQSPSQNAPLTQLERNAQEQMARDRQLTLKRDTDQLLEMATELKQNVDNTGPSILSLDVIKKAEKIEKLAKSIREKMKGD